MDKPDFISMLHAAISDEDFQTIINARRKAQENMSVVGVTVPTKIKLFGTMVYFAFDFDMREEGPK